MRTKASLLLAFLLLTPCLAAVFKADNNVVINSDELIQSNAYYFGNLVSINGNVDGDLIAIGNIIEINGLVNGDLWTAGNSVTINGNITGDLRSGSSSITINGIVNGDLLSGAGQISINKDAIVGEVNAGAAALIISGQVNGNITASVDSLTITDSAIISGFVNYTSDNDALVSDDSTIQGFVQKNLPSTEKASQVTSEFNLFNDGSLIWLSIIGLMISVGTTTLVGVILMKLSERKVNAFKKEMSEDYVNNLVKGFAFLILVPIAAVILLFTVIGAPISIMGGAIYGIMIYLAGVLASFWVGEKTFDILKAKKQTLIVELFIGALIIQLVSWIPIIGWFVKFIIWLLAIGVVMKTCKNSYEECKQKKIC